MFAVFASSICDGYLVSNRRSPRLCLRFAHMEPNDLGRERIALRSSHCLGTPIGSLYEIDTCSPPSARF